jgi:signal peptidase II
MAVGLVGGVVAIDIYTKSWAHTVLAQGATIRGLAGLPMTLAYNEGVAFGLPLPSLGRWLIIGATFIVLSVLSRMFMSTDSRDWPRLLAVQLVGAGAIGNLIDRVRWANGVVDFIGPFDIGKMQFPIFNVADMAITTGAVMLALSLLREESQTAEVVHADVARTDIVHADMSHTDVAHEKTLDTLEIERTAS